VAQVEQVQGRIQTPVSPKKRKKKGFRITHTVSQSMAFLFILLVSSFAKSES
jgi:hypothetical protein